MENKPTKIIGPFPVFLDDYKTIKKIAKRNSLNFEKLLGDLFRKSIKDFNYKYEPVEKIDVKCCGNCGRLLLSRKEIMCYSGDIETVMKELYCSKWIDIDDYFLNDE